MRELTIQAGDGIPMTVIYSTSENHSTHDESAITVFESCLAFIRKESPTVVIFNLIYTDKDTHKIELYYALRGDDEISPMGIIMHEYSSRDLFKACMSTDFTGLEYPL